MSIVRTSDERFADLPDFPYEPHYTQLGPVRMHYVEAGSGDPILCLHGEPTWSFLYRKMIPQLATVGRVIAPDMIGFGRSDKYTDRDAYTFQMHRDALAAFLEALDLRRITLVCQDWGGLLGHDLAALGLPTEAEMVGYYSTLSKRAVPEPALWEFYMAYNLFRVSCIRQGVYARSLDGTASNMRAAESGKLVKPAADLAWEIVSNMSGASR